MSVCSDHHIRGPGGCQFSQWLESLKVQKRKLIAGFKVEKWNVFAKIVFIFTNLFGGFGRTIEEILAEEVVCFYLKLPCRQVGTKENEN